MKTNKLILLFAFLIVFSSLAGCSSAEKAAKQRRNLMMPNKSDLPRNSKYNSPRKKKTYKKKYKKSRKRSSIYIIRAEDFINA